MKLNITPEKLTRQLLIANSTLVNYKGSVKAVRMLLNMLGFKCVVSKTQIAQKFVISSSDSALIDKLQDAISLQVLCCDSGETRHPEDYQYVRYGGGGGEPYEGGAYNPEYRNDDNGQLCYAKLLVTAERQIQPTDAEYGAILTFGVRELRYNEGYELTATQYISYLMQTYQHMQTVTVANFADRAGIDVTVKPLSIVPDVRSQSDLCIMLTNVADADVAPIRTVLAKQLQEILPINMIVKADNIIGMANDE